LRKADELARSENAIERRSWREEELKKEQRGQRKQAW